MAQIAALLLLVLGLLPLANWIPGGHDAPWYGDRLAMWLAGGAIVAGVVVVSLILLRRLPPSGPRAPWPRLSRGWAAGGRAVDATISAVAFGAYAVTSHVVFSTRPLLIDEIIQLWQARVFAAGSLTATTPAYPEFTSAMHLVDLTARSYGQFPAGGPALLALGVLVGAAWLAVPAASALGVYLFARLLRAAGVPAGHAMAALLLAAFAPFPLFLSSSMMNHAPLVTCVIGAALGVVLATRDDRPRSLPAFGAGLALGVGATLRPLDAVAFAIPTACWLAWRVRADRRHLRPLLASGLGVAIPVLALLAVNAVWTGDPLTFGYIALWGRSHALGFHEAPWGPLHTPARGLELVNLYLLRLQTYLFETPVPSTLFAVGALALTRVLRPVERWMLAGSALLLLAYFCYWHDGFYLGPRFILPLAPWLAWWTAGLPEVLRRRAVAPHVVRSLVIGGTVALLIGAFQLLPIRFTQYRNGMLSLRLDHAAAARAAGVKDAVVVVRESWGTQMVARLWAVGVSRTRAEQLYRTVDACILEQALTGVEAGTRSADTLLSRLAPYLADSSRLVALRASPDTSLRQLPGMTYTPRCLRRLVEDQAGFTLWPPLLLVEDGNRWVRDLHARDSLVIDPGRPLYLVTTSPEAGSGLRFERVDRDSMRREWAAP